MRHTSRNTYLIFHVQIKMDGFVPQVQGDIPIADFNGDYLLN